MRYYQALIVVLTLPFGTEPAATSSTTGRAVLGLSFKLWDPQGPEAHRSPLILRALDLITILCLCGAVSRYGPRVWCSPLYFARPNITTSPFPFDLPYQDWFHPSFSSLVRLGCLLSGDILWACRRIPRGIRHFSFSSESHRLLIYTFLPPPRDTLGRPPAHIFALSWATLCQNSLPIGLFQVILSLLLHMSATAP